MAADWIPMRCNLDTDPSVVAIAIILGIDEQDVIGRLHRLWSWANQHLDSGNAPSVTSEWVDRYLRTPGFAAATLRAGWLHLRDGGIALPNFDTWNSQGAKRRIVTARRVASHRQEKCNDVGVTKALPEKRREEKKEIPPNPPSGGIGGGRNFEAEAKALADLYVAKVTSRWASAGKAQFRYLLRDQCVAFADIEAAVINYGLSNDRKNLPREKREAAKNFIINGTWEEFVGGVPEAGCDETAEARDRRTREMLARRDASE